MLKKKPWLLPLFFALLLCVKYIDEMQHAEQVKYEATQNIEYTEEQEITHITQKVPDFSAIADTKERKAAFFDYFYPIVLAENRRILAERQVLLNTKRDSKEFEHLCIKYSRNCDDTSKEKYTKLLKLVDVVPPALVLAQAAKESGWGSSRFALEANNYFGQWCYSKGCGLVPSNRIDGANHEVRRFNNVHQAVRAYLFNLNTSKAYSDLREIRATARQQSQTFLGSELSQGLLYYSEQREAYVDEIKSFIRYNKLTQFDKKFWQEIANIQP